MTQTSGTSRYSEVTEDLFKAAMRDVCALIGRPQPPRETLQLFFKKLKGVDARDFLTACESIDLLQDWSSRRNLCWPTLWGCINKAQTERLERENRRKKVEEKRDYDEMPPDIKEQIDRLIGRMSCQ